MRNSTLNQTPLEALAELERQRANDPAYQARRAKWCERYQKDARKKFWQWFAALAVIQIVLSAAWGHQIARVAANLLIDDITTDAQVHQFGYGLFAGGVLLIAAIARLYTFNDYK